ncbi:MAG: hypothetical protein ACK4HV_05280, partial [Parachlamydiaceae bacterium]
MNKWILTLALCAFPISTYAVDRLGAEPVQDIAKGGGHGGGHHGGGHHGGGHHGGGHHGGGHHGGG